jgi:Domain of unknown function (DUF4398)
MAKSIYVAIGAACAACASYPEPTNHLAASMAAVRGAETAGAEQSPQAALHLKLAREQLAQAENMVNRDDNERADAMAIRAYNDAELALALAREAQSRQKVESYAQAHPEIFAPARNVNELDATDPPGVGAPNIPPTQAR